MNPYLHRYEALETISRLVISQYDRSLLDKPAPIPVEIIMEKVYGLTIEFQHIRKNGRILGETVFEDAMIPIYDKRTGDGYRLVPMRAGTVLIDARLLNNRADGRFRYTCAHELSHWVIDRKYFTQLGETAAMTKAARSSETDAAVERQANHMASCILMPKGTLKMAFYHNRGQYDIVDYLARLFCVSGEAMGYRLKDLGLL